MMKGAAQRGGLTKNDIGSPTNFRHVAHNGQLLTDEPTTADPHVHLLLPCGSQPTDGSTTTQQASDQQPVRPAKRKAPHPPTNQTSSTQSNTQLGNHSDSEGELLNLAQTPCLSPQRKAPLPPLANQIVSTQPITRAVPHSTSEGDLLTLNTDSRLSPQRTAPPPPSANETSPHQQVMNIRGGVHLLEPPTTPHQKKPSPRPPPPRFSDHNTSTNTTNHVTSMLALTAMTTFKLINTCREDDISSQQQVSHDQPFSSSKSNQTEQVDTSSHQPFSSMDDNSDATTERLEREGDVTEEDRREAEEEALGAIEELDAVLLRFSAADDGADSDDDDDALNASQQVVQDIASHATGGLDDDASQQVVQDSATGGATDVEEAGGVEVDPTPTSTATLQTVGLKAGLEVGELTTLILSGPVASGNNVTDVTGEELPDIQLEEGSTSDKEHPSGTLSDISRGSDSGINKCDAFGSEESVDNKTLREVRAENDVVEREDGDTETVQIERSQDSDEAHDTASLTQEEPADDSGVDVSASDVASPRSEVDAASLTQEEPADDSGVDVSSSDVASARSEVDAAPRPSVLNWNPQLRLRLEEIEDKELRLLLEKAGVGNDELEDPGTRDFIYEFIQLHGGKKAVRQEALLLAGLPPGTLRHVRKKKKKMYSMEEDEDNMSTYM